MQQGGRGKVGMFLKSNWGKKKMEMVKVIEGNLPGRKEMTQVYFY